AQGTGLAESKISELVYSGRSIDVLNAALNGLANASGPGVTTALDQMGLASLRTEQGIQRLRQNTDLLADSVANAAKSSGEGVFLDQSFAKVLEDAAGQLKILTNAFTNFLSVAGEPFIQFLKVVVPPAVDVLKALTAIAQTPVGQFVFSWVGGITLLVGVLAGMRATAALVQASAYAMATAFGTAGAGSYNLRTALVQLTGAMLGLRTTATTTHAAVGTGGLTTGRLAARAQMLGLSTPRVGASTA